MKKVLLNGKKLEISDNILTIADLLSSMSIPTVGTAVALNDKVVRKADHEATAIEDNDTVEIVRAVAGG